MKFSFSHLKKGFVFLLVLVALFALISLFTKAHLELLKLNYYFFALSAIAFIASILLWLIGWAYLIKRHSKVSFFSCLHVGLNALYGSLTPVQIGAEVLRSLQLKDSFKISFSKSVSASMVAKGIKFLVIAIIAVIVIILLVITTKIPALIVLGLGTGLFVILLAALLFLLPLKSAYGFAITDFFVFLGNRFHKKFLVLAKFFGYYTNYLKELPRKSYFFVLITCLISFLFELIALNLAFYSVGVNVAIHVALTLLVLVAVLERTPILPRGIGLVEIIGFYFLSIPFLKLSLTTAEIGAVIIVFDLVRLFIPTLLSIITNCFKLNGLVEEKKKK